MKKLLRLALAAFAILTALSFVRATTADERFVIQSVDMTWAGKKLKPPTTENPTYYLPVFQGYKEKGAPSKDYERKPPDRETAKQLIEMLKKEGYIMASRKSPPKIVLVFEWGSIVPNEVDSGDPRGRPPTPNHVTNAAEIKAHVVGERGRDLDRHSTYYSEMTSLSARHFLLISAFEYHQSEQAEEVLLWRAHVTTELWGNYLSEVLPLMIAHAAPIVGKNVSPGGAWTPTNPHVIIGAPVVVPEEKKEEGEKR